MDLIQIKDLVKTLSPAQYLQIFSVDRENEESMVGLYRRDDIPKEILEMYIAYLSSGRESSIQFEGSLNIVDLLLIDAFNTKTEAYNWRARNHED